MVSRFRSTITPVLALHTHPPPARRVCAFFEDRSISESRTRTKYTYDAFGHRVRATLSSTPYDFIFNGGQAVDKVTASSWVWGYAGGVPGITYTNGTTYFDHGDSVGTARARSNVSGTSIETCTSLAFGDSQTCTGTDESPQHFASLQGDSESNLQRALFRQDSTTEGRWTVPDPSGLAAVTPTNPQTWNRYAYVANNPISNVDPSGLLVNDCEWDGCGPGGPSGWGGVAVVDGLEQFITTLLGGTGGLLVLTMSAMGSPAAASTFNSWQALGGRAGT